MTRARGAEVLTECRRPRRVTRPERQHAAEHALRQPDARARQQAAPVARQLEQRDVLHAELARHRGRGHVEQLVERRPLERELAELGHRRLPARADRQLLAVAVRTAPQHPLCPPLAGFADGIALQARLEPQHGLRVEL